MKILLTAIISVLSISAFSAVQFIPNRKGYESHEEFNHRLRQSQEDYQRERSLELMEEMINNQNREYYRNR